MGMPLIGTSPKDPGIIDSIKLGLGNTLGVFSNSFSTRNDAWKK